MEDQTQNTGPETTIPESVAQAEPADELAVCRRERDEYLNGWKRAKADFANYKKEDEERLKVTIRFAEAAVIQEIVRVLDSFDLGLVAWKEETPEKKGMTLIRFQLEDALRKFGCERITIRAGDDFDPGRHECVEAIEGGKPGTVAEEVEPGYLLHGKVIRPTRVKVIK